MEVLLSISFYSRPILSLTESRLTKSDVSSGVTNYIGWASFDVSPRCSFYYYGEYVPKVARCTGYDPKKPCKPGKCLPIIK